jgi:hypothetical protein
MAAQADITKQRILFPNRGSYFYFVTCANIIEMVKCVLVIAWMPRIWKYKACFDLSSYAGLVKSGKSHVIRIPKIEARKRK